MRTMPTFLNDRGRAFAIPQVGRDEFHALLAEIGGREMTPDELSRVDKMSLHNWTLRVQATELFGAEIVDAHFAKTLAELTRRMNNG